MATRKEIERVFEILEIKPSMGTFNDRIKLQKIVYLTEYAFGINLGFDFDWYLHGPYSSELTKVMFDKEKGFGIKLNESKLKKLEKARQFFKTYGSRKELELLGSLCYILKLIKGSKVTDNQAIERFSELKPHFSNKEIRESHEIIKHTFKDI